MSEQPSDAESAAAYRRQEAIADEVDKIREQYDLGEFASDQDPFVRAVLQTRGMYREQP
jgi:hypothetical protein